MELSLITNIFELIKPKIILMILFVALLGMVTSSLYLELDSIFVFILGISLMGFGSNMLNMYVERNYDRLMQRTKNRPLPLKKIHKNFVTFFGSFFSVFSIILLCNNNFIIMIVGILTIIIYVFLYTPLKRIIIFSFIIGTAPGASPIIMGYAVISGKVDFISIYLMGLMFFWQFPHVIAISVFRSNEYIKAGYPILIQFWDYWKMNFFGSLGIVFLLLSSFMLWYFKIGYLGYVLLGLILTIWFFDISYKGFFHNVFLWNKKIFIKSLIYQTFLFSGLSSNIIFSQFY